MATLFRFNFASLFRQSSVTTTKSSICKTLLYNQDRCAGHAKWQNIRNTKQANDLQKGKTISRYVMLVRRAILTGNKQTDPKLNSKLGDVLAEASRYNVPKATLDRAIARAVNLKMLNINLEIQGPEGCTLIAKCETENANLLRKDTKKVLRKFDSNLMPDDTLINMFRSQGFVRTEDKTVDGRDIDGEFAEEAAIMASAQEVYLEEFEDNDSSSKTWVFVVDADTIDQCKGELEKQKFKVISSDLDLVPYRTIEFPPETIEKVESLERALREMEQVVDVYHNVKIAGANNN